MGKNFVKSFVKNKASLSTIASDGGTSEYTDAIDWEGTSVDSGEYNPDGDMVIEYYFTPGTGLFGGFLPKMEWTDYEKQQVDLAFGTYEAIMDVEFVEVDNAADADFKLNKVNSFGLFLGVMNPPGTPGEGSGGFAGESDFWDEGDAFGNPVNGSLEQGGFGFITLIHELGHGLGLAHPHDDGGGSTVLPGVTGSDDTGTDDLNQGVYTMMSYVDGWATNPNGALNPSTTPDYGWVGTPMAVDVALLQHKYGANDDYNTGDDIYYLPDVNDAGTFYSCIWDAGGNDTMAYTGSSDVVIDLRDATLLLEEGGGGWISYTDGINGGYTIAYSVSIENAIGGSGNDALVSNEADNTLTGGAGADTFIFDLSGGGADTITDFGQGNDLVDVSGMGQIRRSDVSVSHDGNGDVEVQIFDDQAITFAGMSFSDLSMSDFVFA